MADSQPAGMITTHLSGLSIIYKILDILAITLTLIITCELKNVEWIFKFDIPLLGAPLLFLIYADFNALYRPWRGAPFRQHHFRVFSAWIFVVFTLLFLGFATGRSKYYHREAIFIWFVLTPFVICLWRTLFAGFFRRWRKKGNWNFSVAIAGVTTNAIRLGQIFEKDSWLGMEFVGFYDDRSVSRLQHLTEEPLEIKGDLQKMVRLARKGEISRVYITLPMTGQKRIQALIYELADTVASVYIVPDFFVFNIIHGKWSSIFGIPTISVFENPFSGAQGWVKRLEDLILGILFLAVAAIPMLLIGILIKSTSKGPVFFAQRRLGLNGEEIKILKFRTLYNIDDDTSFNMKQVMPDDSRIAPMGQFLRSTSLDEIPQLLNVLQGKMSLVGPRPHALGHNEDYRNLIHGYMLRHKVKPGITGWAQINGFRGPTQTPEKMRDRIQFDQWYIRNWSIWLDLKIIFLTLIKGAFLEKRGSR